MRTLVALLLVLGSRSPGGTIDTVAGTGRAGSEGDGGLASAASLVEPFGCDLDASGRLWIADEDCGQSPAASRFGHAGATSVD